MARPVKPDSESLRRRMPVIAMSDEMFEWVEARARELEVSRADVVRTAIEKEMKRYPKKKEE